MRKQWKKLKTHKNALKKRPKTPKFAKTSKKTRQDVPFGGQSDSKQEELKEKSKNIEKAKKKA